MELIKRNHCVISGNDDLEHLYTFEDFPVFMGCVEHSLEKDLKTDMSWWISKCTGSLQLNLLIPLNILYKDSHGSGTVGGLWDRHHKEFAKFIKEFNVAAALEIGAGHGELVQNYLDIQPNTIWTIIEPNPKIESSKQIKVVKGLFTSDYQIDSSIDAIVHSHVLEHIYEPLEFMRDIATAVDIGTWQIFSIPNLEEMLKRKYTNCINFEHTTYLTEPFVDYLLNKFGFEVQSKKYFLDDHSIFYAAKKVSGLRELSLPNEYDINKKVYNEYLNFHRDLVRDLNQKMEEFSGKVYLFGGHVFSQYLLGFGLNAENIECILDNDTNKNGKRLYGSNLIVRLPKVLASESNSAVILRAGVYNLEIKQDIFDNINDSVEFWE